MTATLTDGRAGDVAPDGEPDPPRTPATRVTLDIVVPVYNEEIDLPRSVARLHDYLSSQVPMSFRITIADNASTDATAAIADGLAARFAQVRAVPVNCSWIADYSVDFAPFGFELSSDLTITGGCRSRLEIQ